jgi:hypothetical protein
VDLLLRLEESGGLFPVAFQIVPVAHLSHFPVSRINRSARGCTLFYRPLTRNTRCCTISSP